MRVFARILVAALVGLVWLAASPGSVFAQPACNPNPSDAERSQALEAMGTGGAYWEDPDRQAPEQRAGAAEDAYPHFKRAYTLTCSVNALFNVALAAVALELDGEAIEAYEIVLAKKTDFSPEDRQLYESDLARLKASVAWIVVTAASDGVKLEDARTPRSGAPIRNTYTIGTKETRIGIHPGTHRFVAINQAGVQSAWDQEIAAGSNQEHHFEFTGPPGPAPGGGPGPGPGPGGGDKAGGGGFPVYVWVAGGVTIASAITMGVLMGVSFAKKNDYEENILGKVSTDEQVSAAEDVQTLSVVADVFIGVTVALAATTVILAVTAPSKKEASAKSGPRFGVDYTVAPMIDDQGGGAALSVKF
jgi:hypothetical protein